MQFTNDTHLRTEDKICAVERANVRQTMRLNAQTADDFRTNGHLTRADQDRQGSGRCSIGHHTDRLYGARRKRFRNGNDAAAAAAAAVLAAGGGCFL